jgi:hypothetical protein
MSLTFDAYKQKVEKYLQEVIAYDDKGNKSHKQRELQVLKDECKVYKQTFETQCKTSEKLMEFRRRMENTWDEVYKEINKKPADGRWETDMISNIKSKMESCISSLIQMEARIKSGAGPDLTERNASLDLTEQISKSLAQLKRFL